ncbi:MAG: hypothetical protein HY258_11880 [Chloroflexi bacterium]|nr:hypothetical protein [Chloroflexota bacterium]
MKKQKSETRISLAAILLMGLLFVLLFGVANGRNSAHYVLSTYVALDVLAAVGWVLTADMLRDRTFGRIQLWLSPIILSLAILIQAGSAMAFFPYYYTYYNPIMEALKPGSQNSNFGYGEVLEQAASYLSQQPDAAEMTVISYRGRGPFSYFFPGKTEELKNVYAEAKNVPELERIIQHSDYIVLYYEPEKKIDRPANVLRALEDVPPQYVIWVNGIEYIRIFRVASLPPDFYKLLEP